MGKYAKERTKLFIKKYGVDIAMAIDGSGLYFAMVVGQKCNESGYGTSNLAVNFNNFGGIQYGAGVDGAIGHNGRWAVFPTPYACFKAYVNTIKSPKKNYLKMGVLSATSPEEQLKRIILGGYCPPTTDKNAKYYLSICQGAIDAAREICPLGKIDNLKNALSQLASL